MRVESLGQAPEGYTAWLESGHFHLCGPCSVSIALAPFVATSLPRWTTRGIEICTISQNSNSRLVWLDLGGTAHFLELPRRTVDAVPLKMGWAVARANSTTGHLNGVGRVNCHGELIWSENISPSWRVASQQCVSATGIYSAIWHVSRQGQRHQIYQVEDTLQERVGDWPGPEWTRWWIGKGGHPRLSAWVKQPKRSMRVWIVFHGGPGLAWDREPPLWVSESLESSDAVVLLESPGSVGYGGPLLRWGYDGMRAELLSQAIDTVLARIRSSMPNANIILAGESDGACLLYEMVCIIPNWRDQVDLYVLLNGEYDDFSPLKSLENKVVFMSWFDEVVDASQIPDLGFVVALNSGHKLAKKDHHVVSSEIRKRLLR